MVKLHALDRKLLRDIRRLWSQALAIVLVLACGVAILLTAFGMVRALDATFGDHHGRQNFAELFSPASAGARGADRRDPCDRRRDGSRAARDRLGGTRPAGGDRPDRCAARAVRRRGVSLRDRQSSHAFIDAELAQLRNMAIVLLGRIVALERAGIGLLKAAGNRDAEIALHYFFLAALVAAIGIGIGWGPGTWLTRSAARRGDRRDERQRRTGAGGAFGG